MIFVDTGALIARYRTSDDWHEAARAGWKQIALTRPRCFTTNRVIAEASRLLRPYVGAERLALLVGTWLHSEVLVIEHGDLSTDRAAVGLMSKYADQGVGFVDAVSCHVMRRNHLRQAFSFDRHFTVAGFTLWPSTARRS